MGLVGARVPVKSRKMETFLESAFEGSLEETFFFFGSDVIEEEEAEEVAEVDTGF